MKYVISFIIGYLLGCLNLAYVLSKKNKMDFQNSGSKNLGASNTVLHLGIKAGIAVAIHDIFKTIIAILIVKYLYGIDDMLVVYIAGAAAVIGHIFPFWLKFKAGKGFAPYIGLILSTMNYKYIIFLILLCLIMLYITDYIVAATFTCITILPIYTIIMTNNIILCAIISITSLIIFLKHIENIKRIRNKTETHLRTALFKNNNRN